MDLTLSPVNAHVVEVHAGDTGHVGNLKRIGAVWKFKAVGDGAGGAIELGGGPLTAQHNTLFDAPGAQAVNARLAAFS